MNFRFLLIIIVGLSMFSCMNDKNELEGHWHLYVGESDKYNQYEILNIRNDTILDFKSIDFLKSREEIHFLKNGKNINIDSQFILLYDGMYGLYDYELTGDRITLNERSDLTAMGFDYWGLRKNIEKCDVLDDLFSKELIKVSLPKILEIDSITNLSKGFVFDIMIGTNKITGILSIQVEDRVVGSEELSLEFEKFKMKIPKNKLDQLILRLSIDNAGSLNMLGEQYELIKNFPFQQRVERKLDWGDNESVVLVKIE